VKTLDSFISQDIRLFYDSNLDESVYLFQDLVYEYISEREYKGLLLGTELKFIVDELFGPTLELGKFVDKSNSTVELQSILDNSIVVKDMLFFYGGIYSDAGTRDVYEELKSTWEDHRNTVYRLASLLLLHVMGMFIVKENLC
tara:strand:+ start:129 stop:557 length:429 start_codon:yes stop_codon:yes gene_type:complete